MSEDGKFKCRDCGEELCWSNDYTYDDYGIEHTEGIVSVYSCLSEFCSVDLVKIYTKIESK